MCNILCNFPHGLRGLVTFVNANAWISNFAWMQVASGRKPMPVYMFISIFYHRILFSVAVCQLIFTVLMNECLFFPWIFRKISGFQDLQKASICNFAREEHVVHGRYDACLFSAIFSSQKYTKFSFLIDSNSHALPAYNPATCAVTTKASHLTCIFTWP